MFMTNQEAIDDRTMRIEVRERSRRRWSLPSAFVLAGMLDTWRLPNPGLEVPVSFGLLHGRCTALSGVQHCRCALHNSSPCCSVQMLKALDSLNFLRRSRFRKRLFSSLQRFRCELSSENSCWQPYQNEGLVAYPLRAPDHYRAAFTATECLFRSFLSAVWHKAAVPS
jgi:hypothetical protein